MSAAEELYHDFFGAQQGPPLILDAIFILIMIAVHSYYLIKFTTFSLSYLETRILERKNDEHYAASERYFYAVREWRTGKFGDDDDSMDGWNRAKIMKEVDGTVWKQLRFLRWFLKIGMGVSGLMLYILFVICQINLIYEFVVLSFLEGIGPTILAIIILPFWTYTCIVIARWGLSGVSIMWNIKVDDIGNKISREDDDERERKILEIGVADNSAGGLTRYFTAVTAAPSMLKKMSTAAYDRMASLTQSPKGSQPVNGHQQTMTESQSKMSIVPMPGCFSAQKSEEAAAIEAKLCQELNGLSPHDDHKESDTKEHLNGHERIMTEITESSRISAISFADASNPAMDGKEKKNTRRAAYQQLSVEAGAEMTELKQVAVDTKPEDDILTAMEKETDRNCCGCKRRRQHFTHNALQGFFCPFFMAVRWRLVTFVVTGMASVCAMLYVSDEQFMHLFVRYLLLSAGIWVTVYGIFSLSMGLYARCRTRKGIDMTGFQITLDRKMKELRKQGNSSENEIVRQSTDYQREEESRYYKFRTRCQMVCCLKDDYGFIDKVTEWTRCKLITVTLIWITIIGLLVMRLFVYDGGFLGFAACILTIYYVVTLILANVKPHGIYVLCKGDAMALKVRKWRMDTQYEDQIQRAKDNDIDVTVLLKDLDLDHNKHHPLPQLKEPDVVPAKEQDAAQENKEEAVESKEEVVQINKQLTVEENARVSQTKSGGIKSTCIYPMLFDSVYHQNKSQKEEDIGYLEVDRVFQAWCNSSKQQQFKFQLCFDRKSAKCPISVDESAKLLLEFARELDEASLSVERFIAERGSTDETISSVIEAECEKMYPLWRTSMFWDLRQRSKQYEEERQKMNESEKSKAEKWKDSDLRRIHNLYQQYKGKFGEECHELLDPETNEWNEALKEGFEQWFKEKAVGYFKELEERGTRPSDKGQESISIYTKFNSLFTLYGTYWKVLLPYSLERRPLAVCFTQESHIEDMINCCYKGTKDDDDEDKTMRKKTSDYFVDWCKGYFCCCVIVLLFIAAAGTYHTLYVQVHGDNDISWNQKIEEMVSSPLLYNTKDSLPICEIPWNGNLSTADLTVLTEMVYALGQDDVTMLTQQEMMCLYFDTMNIAELRNGSSNLTEADCAWQVVYNATHFPYFVHLRNDDYLTDVIAIRGTASIQETMQDFVLYNQVAMIQMASWTIPMTSILPRRTIANMVYYGSLLDGIISRSLREQYDGPIFEYARSLLENTTEPIDSLYFVGHSLGGGLAKIVGAQIYRAMEDGYIDNTMNNSLIDGVEIKSFALASPGLSFGARKFSIHVEDIYKTAMEIRPELDRVSAVDEHVGQVSFVECPRDNMIECHLGINAICKMMTECNAYKLHNPDLVATWCELDDSSTPLMNLWNSTYYSSE